MKESELDSEEFSQIASRSLTVKSKFSQSRTWLRRWKRTKFIRLLCGRTLKPSLSENFEGVWTSYLGDFLANHFLSVTAVAEDQQKTPGTCSHTYLKASNSADPDLFSWKTSRESSHPKQEMEKVFSNMSSDHWKKWVIDQRQEYLVRLKSVRLTKENESSSWATPRANAISSTRPNNKGGIPLGDQVNRSEEAWHTPNTMDGLPVRSEEALRKQARGTRKGRTKPANLREQVDPKAVEIYKEESKRDWPTARVSDVEGGRIKTEMTDKGFRSRRIKSDQWFGAKLRDAVETYEETGGPPAQENPSTIGKNQESWATPQARDFKSGKRVNSSSPFPQLNTQIENKSLGKLNPNWVEQLMGLPVGWTQLPTEWID